MDYIKFAGYAGEQFGVKREAFLRFTIATALAYHGASVIGGNGAGDDIKSGIKKALRDRGENRKTADENVNNACKAALPLVEKYGAALSFDGAISATIEALRGALRLDSINSTYDLMVALGVKGKRAKKEKEEAGVESAARILAAQDAGAGEESAGGAPQAPAALTKAQGVTVAGASLSQEERAEIITALVVTLSDSATLSAIGALVARRLQEVKEAQEAPAQEAQEAPAQEAPAQEAPAQGKRRANG